MKKIHSLLKQIHSIGPVLPGSLESHFNVCGNPNCRCKDKKNPKKHGPYFRLSYSLAGKNSSMFVKKEDVEIVEKMVTDYRKLRGLTVDLALESLTAIKEMGVHATMEAIEQQQTNPWKEKCREKGESLRTAQVKIRDISRSRDKWKLDCIELRKKNRALQQQLQNYESKTDKREPTTQREKKTY